MAARFGTGMSWSKIANSFADVAERRTTENSHPSAHDARAPWQQLRPAP